VEEVEVKLNRQWWRKEMTEVRRGDSFVQGKKSRAWKWSRGNKQRRN